MPKLSQYNGREWIEIAKNGRDGFDAPSLEEILAQIPKPIKNIDYFDGKDGSPDTPIQIGDKLNTLEEHIKIKVVKGLEDRLKRLAQSVREKAVLGGGGGMTLMAASGAVDNSNTVFTFPYEPKVVVVNGASYRDGRGVTISGRTATLDNPVGNGGDIFATG